MGKSNWPIYGHETIVALLQKTLHSQSGPRHAYLFLGARHVGKSTVAHTFAKALLCDTTKDAATDAAANDPQAQRPCNTCRPCRLLDSGNYPDFQLIQPLDKDGNPDRQNGQLRAEQAAQIIQDSVLSPFNGRYKIFVIQEMQQANASFANKLLKTLEEPPAHVIFCLTAPDRASLLPTIVSRCQICELRMLPSATIEAALRDKWQVEADQASLLARLSNGRLGWAVEQLADKNVLQKRNDDLDTLCRLIEADRVERLAFAEKLSAARSDRQLFGMLETWILWWRDVLLTQSGYMEVCCNVDKQAEILQHAQAVPQQIVQRYIHTLQRIESYLRHTTNLRMALDVALLQMPRVAAQ